MKIIAITDHDIVPKDIMMVDGVPIKTMDYAKQKGIKVILGTEYSCDSDVDDVHIVGLGCHWDNELFQKMNKKIQMGKIIGYRKLTEALIENGIDVTWDEVLYNGGDKRRDEDVQRKHIFEQIAKNGYAQRWQDAKLMVKNNPKLNVKRDKPDPLYVIDLIHKTGGIAILAHPYLIDEPIECDYGNITRKEYIKKLIDAGLDGIEAAYTYSKTSYDGNMTEDEIEKVVIENYSQKLSVISGGSDYHNDGKKGTKSPRMIGEKGITPEYFYGNKVLSKL
jgi:3',5'-nucleoside bisphosphate phosphatase